MPKLAALLAPLALVACVCEPTVHVEVGYASPVMADSIEQCARDRACTVLCARTFALSPGEIDSCRIVRLDGNGGADVEVTYTTYTCVADDWSSDSGDDWSSDPGGDDDPCSYGACDEPYPDDPPPDDEPPPDDDEPPPDDDPPPDDRDPDMEF